MVARLRVVHYLNQFFGGVGGEDQADLAPRLVEGPRGPGALLERLDRNLTVVATIIAGDNYMAAHLEEGVAEVAALLARWTDGHRRLAPDVLIAGPAFGAGRYGLACAAVCRAVTAEQGLPSVTGLHPDNVAVEPYRRDVVIVAAGSDVLSMADTAQALVAVARLLTEGGIPDPAVDRVLTQGRRRNVNRSRTGAERAVAMLLARLGGEPFVTEYPMPVYDRVPPAPPVRSLPNARVALVTTGGIVPRGNPDRIESSNASRFGVYPLDGVEALSSATHQSVHGGYDPTFANADPNRVLPVDAMREVERTGGIGALHHRYVATVGNGTAVEAAARFGRDIAALLVNEGVQAVVLTST